MSEHHSYHNYKLNHRFHYNSSNTRQENPQENSRNDDSDKSEHVNKFAQYLDFDSMLANHIAIADSVLARVRILIKEVASSPSANVPVIESNQNYSVVQKSLLQLAGVKSIVPYIISSFVDHLERINIQDKYAYIAARSEESVNQIYVLLLLLSGFVDANWRMKEKQITSTVDKNVLKAIEDTNKSFPHRVSADPLDATLVMKMTRVLIKFKSLKKCINMIRQLNNTPSYPDLTYADQTIIGIDVNIDVIANYFSSASPAGYSKTTELAVAHNENISNYDILGYLELLQFIDLSESKLEREFRLLINFTGILKNIYILHIHSTFFITSLVNYAISDPKSFIDTIALSSVGKIGEIYFEKIYGKFKASGSNERRFYMRAIACSLVLMPKQFEIFVNAEDKSISKVSNKKQKLLHNLVRNLSVRENIMPTLEFFLFVFNIASLILQYDEFHPIVLFAKKYVLPVYNVLDPSNISEFIQRVFLYDLDEMKIEFHALAMVLTPELIEPKVITIIANPDISLPFFYIITSAIASLLTKPYHRQRTYKLIETVSITLRDHCGRLSKIIEATKLEYNEFLQENQWKFQSPKSETPVVQDSRALVKDDSAVNYKEAATSFGKYDGNEESISSKIEESSESADGDALKAKNKLESKPDSKNPSTLVGQSSHNFLSKMHNNNDEKPKHPNKAKKVSPAASSSRISFFGPFHRRPSNRITIKHNSNTSKGSLPTLSSVDTVKKAALKSKTFENSYKKYSNAERNEMISSAFKSEGIINTSEDRINLDNISGKANNKSSPTTTSTLSSNSIKNTENISLNNSQTGVSTSSRKSISVASNNSSSTSTEPYRSSNMKKLSDNNQLNMIYMNRVGNNSFLSREILKLLFQIFQNFPSFFFRLPGIYEETTSGRRSNSLMTANQKKENSLMKEIKKTQIVIAEMKRILDPILISMADNDVKLSECSRRLTIRILDADENTSLDNYIALFCSCYIQSGFVDICLKTMLSDCKFLEVQSVVALLVSKRIDLLERIKNVDYLFDKIGVEGQNLYKNAISDLEKLILVSLCTPGIEFFKYVKANCLLISNELKIKGFYMSKFKKLINYKFMDNIANENYYVSSQVGLQKRIRGKLLKYFDSYSTGMLNAIDICYQRWADVYFQRSNVDVIANAEFRNYAKFLAVVMGGFGKYQPSFNASWFSGKQEALKTFISSQYKLLDSGDFNDRQFATELFSNELHPNSYKLFIDIVSEKVDGLIELKKRPVFGSNYIAAGYEPLTDKDIILLDSYLTIFIGFLNSNKSTINYELNASMRLMASKYAILLKNPITSASCMKVAEENNNVHVIRLKIKTCKFYQKFTKTYDNIIDQTCSVKWRNEAINLITRWLDVVCFGANFISDYHIFTLGDSDLSNIKKEVDMFSYYDLTLEALKAIGNLFKNTQIFMFECYYKTEVTQIRSVIFNNYFNLFSRILESCLSRTVMSGVAPSPVERKIELIKDEVILVISNMLEPNYDIGLDKVLHLSLHSDAKVKHAFLVVFTNIIENIEKSKVNKNKDFERNSFLEISELLTNTDLLLAMIKCKHFDNDIYPDIFFKIIMASNQAIKTMSELFEYEVHISKENTLVNVLRKNSVPAKIMSLYAKEIGKDYLIELLRPIVNEIVTDECIINYSISQCDSVYLHKDTDGSDSKGVNLLFDYLKILVRTICESVERVPNEIKILCAHIREIVLRKFNNEKISSLVLSSFLFLRFICPVLVSPEREGIILKAPGREAKRFLLGLAKLLQNIANDSLKGYSQSEEHEIFFEAKKDLFNFLSLVSNEEKAKSLTVPIRERYIFSKETFSEIYSFIVTKNTEIFLNILYHNGWRKSSIKKLISDCLGAEKIFSNLGHDYVCYGHHMPEFIKNNKDTYPELYDLFIRYRDVIYEDLISKPFISQSYFRDGTFFICISMKYMKEVIEYDLDVLVFRAIQVCQAKWHQPFRILFDFSLCNEEALKKYKQFNILFNEYCKDLWDECSSISFYNISDVALPFIQALVNHIMTKVPKNSASIGFFTPFDDYNLLKSIGVPEYSLSSVKAAQTTIDCLKYSETQKKYIPFMIRFAKEYIYWSDEDASITADGKVYKTRVTVTSKSSDWIDFKEEDHVKNDGSEFKVTVKGFDAIYLSFTKKSIIMNSLVLARIDNDLPAISTDPISSKKLMASEDSFLGSMLAVVLSNMFSNSEEVRNVAYKLLALLISSYKLKTNNTISAKGATFPKDFIPYILEVGETLCTNHPEFTGDFIYTITEGYETSESKYGCMMLLSLNIKNIHDYFMKENRKQKIKEIIHHFLSKIPDDAEPLMLTFKVFVWKNIVNDPNLIGVAVKDIINEAIKREIQGKSWDNIISIISYFPTAEVYKLIIDELKTLIEYFNDNSNGQILLNITWIKARILAKSCESLSFDSLFLVENFFPDICFVVSMLINIGPYELKKSIRNLIINVLRAFLSKPNLSQELHDFIFRTIDEFSGPSSKITFGLVKSKFEYYNVLSNRADQIPGIYDHLESFCYILLNFMDLHPPDIRNLLKLKWYGYSLDVSRGENGPLQGRGVLVASIILGVSLNEEVLYEFIKGFYAYARTNFSNFEVFLCYFMAFSNFSKSLKKESPFMKVFFFIATEYCLLENNAIFMICISFLKNCIERMLTTGYLTEFGTFSDTVSATWAEFKSFADVLDPYFEISFSKKYFDQVLLALIIRSMKISYIKRISFEFLDLMFEVRFGHDVKYSKITEDDDSIFYSEALCYLALAYIVEPFDRCNEVMKKYGLDNTVVTFGEIAVPKLLVEFFAKGDETSFFTLYQISVFYELSQSNEYTKIKYLVLLNALKDKCPELVLYGFCIINDDLMKDIDSTGTFALLEQAYKLIEFVSSNPLIDTPNILIESYNEIFKKEQLIGIQKLTFSKDDPLSTQEMDKINHHKLKSAAMSYFSYIIANYNPSSWNNI